MNCQSYQVMPTKCKYAHAKTHQPSTQGHTHAHNPHAQMFMQAHTQILQHVGKLWAHLGQMPTHGGGWDVQGEKGHT